MEPQTEEKIFIYPISIVLLKKGILYLFQDWVKENGKFYIEDMLKKDKFKKVMSSNKNKDFQIKKDMNINNVSLEFLSLRAPLYPVVEDYYNTLQSEGKVSIILCYFVFEEGHLPIAKTAKTIELTYQDFVEYKAELKLLMENFS